MGISCKNSHITKITCIEKFDPPKPVVKHPEPSKPVVENPEPSKPIGKCSSHTF